jgi:hypothetical protein
VAIDNEIRHDPARLVLYLIYTEVKPLWETAWAPCAKFLTEAEVGAITGKPSSNVHARYSDWSCTAYYDDITVDYDKEPGPSEVLGYRGEVKDLRADTNVAKVEDVPELAGAGGRVASAGAVLAHEPKGPGGRYYLRLLVEQDNNSYVKVSADYPGEPTEAQRRALIDIVGKKIGISTGFFHQDN